MQDHEGENGWKEQAEAWWETSIIEMSPGVIRYHGTPVEELIGNVSFPEMIWFMLRGTRPNAGQAALLGHALVAAVDHGPQAPSIAIARMAATCGVGINSAMASAINALGDVHGGAGEQAVAFYSAVDERAGEGGDVAQAVADELDVMAARGVKYVPGFGHRFHPTDPRSPRLLALIDEAAAQGAVSGRFAAIARATEDEIAHRKGRRIPMNIDGATGAIYAELGFAPPLCRGLFVLSRSVGVLAHAWEQMQRGERNKGPLPRDATWKYTPLRPDE
ncbi:citryl-CoA lyase [Alkalilacustris brevis]|uniref:citryl-CoA lyase n=1 Tax=Alkalilacustris brevis TaxID=2026338 RepID=UPI000E0CC5D8|nr:citryl-CoA lyase [Alkalilacustris brevis]